MSLELFVLGSGGMMPLPGRHLTSVLLRRKGDLFLFDCGEGTQVALRKLNLRWKSIAAIFITHTHADHVTGLPGLLMLSSQVERSEPLYIYGPPKIAEYVEASKKTLDMYINYPIIVKEFTAPGVVCQSDEFVISSLPLIHSKPCYGYLFQETDRPGRFFPEKAQELQVPIGPLWSKLQDGHDITLADGRTIQPQQVTGDKRRGRKIAFITDTLYPKGIESQLTGCDLLICEGMFTEDMAEKALAKRHLTAKQAARLARNSGGIGSLWLIHYSPRYSNQELKKLQQEAREIFSSTYLSRDGQSIELKNID